MVARVLTRRSFIARFYNECTDDDDDGDRSGAIGRQNKVHAQFARTCRPCGLTVAHVQPQLYAHNTRTHARRDSVRGMRSI